MDQASQSDNGNGKVTIAVLGNKIDSLIELVHEMKSQVNEDRKHTDTRLRCLEGGQVERQTQIVDIREDIREMRSLFKEHEVDIDKLKFNDKLWGGISSSIAVLATIISGVFRGE